MPRFQDLTVLGTLSLGANASIANASNVSIDSLFSGIINNVRVVTSESFSTIQSAIDDLPSTGGTVFLPAGTYTLTTGLTMDSNQRLIGAGMGHTIVQAGASIDLVNDNGAAIDNLEISGITFDGQKGMYTGAGTRFDFGSATNIFIHHCEFVDIARAAINITGANNTDVIISDCKFDNVGTDRNDTAPGNATIYIDGTTRVSIHGNTLNNGAWVGIRVASFNASNNVAIVGNSIHDHDYGISPTGNAGGLNGLVVSGNSIYEGQSADDGNGIDVGGAIDFSIVGNTISRTTDGYWTGINTDGSQRGSIIGNTIRGTRSHGIQLGAAAGNTTSDIVVTGNHIEDAGDDGITASGAGTYTRLAIFGNQIRSSTNSDYDLGSVTDVEGLTTPFFSAFLAAGVALSNGTNNNVDISGAGFIRITGPTAAYTITGFNGGTDGRILFLHNTVSQNLTIANQSASSTAANRIVTFTGADVTGTGVSSAVFVYDGTDSRWILVSNQA